METIARLAVLLSIATGFLAGMVAAPTDARAPTTIGARAPMTIGGLDISCGRAEPSRSSAGLLAIGAAVVALAGSLRMDPDR
jgi:hypothetical protein